MRWPFGPPHLTLKPSKKNKKKQNKEQKTKKKRNKEGLGPSEVALWATSPTKNTKKKKKKTNKKKPNKKTKKKKKRSPKKKQQKYQKVAFQLSVKFFLFWVAFQNFPFLTPWPRKRAPKKHYKNRGFRAFFFGKQMCVTKRPFLDQKKPKFINFSYHFFLPIFFLSKTKNTKICWNPYFYSVLANLKKENFQKKNSKHWKLKKTNFCTPFLKKAIFR